MATGCRLCWLQSKELVIRADGQLTRVRLGTDFDHTTFFGANASTTCNFITPADLHVCGNRCFARDNVHGGSYFVFDRAGTMLRTISNLCLERVALRDGGRTMILTASPVGSRTGSADWVPWPDPRMREAYVGVFDTDTGVVLNLVERSKGATRGFADAPGTVAVASDIRGGTRIELFKL